MEKQNFNFVLVLDGNRKQRIPNRKIKAIDSKLFKYFSDYKQSLLK